MKTAIKKIMIVAVAIVILTGTKFGKKSAERTATVVHSVR
ncbi:hypothetical protein SAMN05421820_109180 [Pedobacter steynii]|uniref:Uncharacterized protein n=1 Tax=Pedobacter steynii TaxID=430522 RepID=A0A1H0E3M6_9SPHI|nr:hypothetical protein SAMN05421820_109180 [Pedobacter steynii]